MEEGGLGQFGGKNENNLHRLVQDAEQDTKTIDLLFETQNSARSA